MPGDLNLKKSWHPGLLSNQAKVWQSEQNALKERKKIEEVRRERDEERQREELDRLAEESGGAKRQQRVDWMYTGASAGTLGTTEEQEAFLLGKRRVDTILKREIQRHNEKAPEVERDPTRDIVAKVSLDPLLQIERQQKEAMEKQAIIEAKIQEREMRRKGKDRNERHHSSRRDRHRDHERSHDKYRGRERSYSNDREDKSRKDRYSKNDRSDSRDRHYRYERQSRNHDRSRSPQRRDSRSPRRRPSPRRERKHSHSPKRHDRQDRQDKYYSGPSHSRSEPNFKDRKGRDKVSNEEKQARLAAMQNDASELEDDRLRRIADIEQRDAEEKAREDRKRDKGVNFKSSLYTQTESIGLEARLKNTRREQLTS